MLCWCIISPPATLCPTCVSSGDPEGPARPWGPHHRTGDSGLIQSEQQDSVWEAVCWLETTAHSSEGKKGWSFKWTKWSFCFVLGFFCLQASTHRLSGTRHCLHINMTVWWVKVVTSSPHQLLWPLLCLSGHVLVLRPAAALLLWFSYIRLNHQSSEREPHQSSIALL